MYNPDTAHYRRPSVTAYNRLIPAPVSIEFGRNLRAEIQDPLWLLARQWQMGEFKAEDAGSPAFARIESSQIQPQSLRLDPNLPPESYNSQQMPLEVIVEREAVAASVHLRIQAGFYFQKLLKIRGLGQHHGLFITAYPLPMGDLPTWDTEGQLLLKSTRGQLVDGFLIKEDFNNAGRLENFIKSKLPNDPSALAALLAVAKDLNQWFNRTYPAIATTTEAAKPRAWDQEQLEYSFAFELKDSAGKVNHLRSDNYADGQLDWPDFTWSGDATLSSAEKKAESFVPTSVRYQGMPRPRFWEMEEGRVNFGMISMLPSNMLPVAFAEFGLAYSNDWFWIPVPLKVNTLCRIDNLVVTNVFGEKIIYTTQDTKADDPLSIFSLYQLSDTEKGSAQSILYLPPTLTKIQEAEPLERVYFLRDETSNLVWAAETVAPSTAQLGIAMRTAAPQADENIDSTQLIYRLGKTTPENWTPFLPVKINHSTQLRLQRAQIPGGLIPKGQILQDIKLNEKPYFLREEEVGRAGTVLERSWQRARWLNGKTYTWIGRRKTIGRIEEINILEWDTTSKEYTEA
jgi:hypothetical protein